MRRLLERRAFEFVDVSGDLVQVCPAHHVETEHLEGPLGWRAARVQKNQDAGDQRAVDLDLDAVLLRAEQVPTSE